MPRLSNLWLIKPAWSKMIGFNEIAATFSGFHRSIAELVQRFVTIRLPLADTLATSALFNSIILEWSQYHRAVHYCSCRFGCSSNYESQTGMRYEIFASVSSCVALLLAGAWHGVINLLEAVEDGTNWSSSWFRLGHRRDIANGHGQLWRSWELYSSSFPIFLLSLRERGLEKHSLI